MRQTAFASARSAISIYAHHLHYKGDIVLAEPSYLAKFEPIKIWFLSRASEGAYPWNYGPVKKLDRVTVFGIHRQNLAIK